MTGTGCSVDNLNEFVATFALVVDGETAAAFGTTVPDDSGAWSGELTVPTEADPSLAYEVVADCWGTIDGDNGQTVLDYGPIEFDVTGDGPTPTTETTVTTPPPTEPGVPTPPPATPVVRPPDQTG